MRGDQLRLRSGTRTKLCTITSTFSRNRGSKINNGRLVILPLDTAQELMEDEEEAKRRKRG